MDYLSFLIANVSAVLIALGFACALLPARSRLQQAFAVLAGYPIVMIVCLLLLGATGQLRPSALVMLLAVLAIATLIAVVICRRRPIAVRDAGILLVQEDLNRLAIPTVLLAAFAAVILVRVCFSGTQFFADDLGYHGPKVVRWIQDEKFSYATRNMTAYYPGNSELLSLWYALPFHNDAWAGLAGLLAVVLIFFAAVVMCREQGQSWATGLLIAALVVSSPGIIWQVRTFSATDLFGGAFVLAAICFAGLAARRFADQSGLAESLYAGLLMGAALGTKIIFLPVFLIIFGSFCLVGRSRTSPLHRIKCLLLFCGAVLLTGAYWFIRNLLITGNPLFPAQIGPFAGPWTREQQMLETLATISGQSAAQWLAIIKKDFDWPISLAALSLCGYLAALIHECSKQWKDANENLALQRILLLSGLALLSTYPFLPFSGNQYSWRYLTAAFLIGLVLFGTLIDEHCRLHWFWRGMAAIGLVTCWPGPGNNVLIALVGAAAGLGLLWRIAKITAVPSPLAMTLGVLIATTTFFGATAALTTHQAQATANNLLQHGDADQPIGKGWLALESAPPGSCIACWMNKSYEFMPLFGRKFQFHVVPLEPDGAPSLPLHERKDLAPNQLSPAFDKSRSYDSAKLLANLNQAGINFVFVSKWPGDKWPAQYEALSKADNLAVFYRDDYSVIWEIKPPK